MTDPRVLRKWQKCSAVMDCKPGSFQGGLLPIKDCPLLFEFVGYQPWAIPMALDIIKDPSGRGSAYTLNTCRHSGQARIAGVSRNPEIAGQDKRSLRGVFACPETMNKAITAILLSSSFEFLLKHPAKGRLELPFPMLNVGAHLIVGTEVTPATHLSNQRRVSHIC
jgi:hypothetical protein